MPEKRAAFQERDPREFLVRRCAQAHAYAFGAFRNQNAVAPDVVLASAVTSTSLAFLKIAAEVKDRRFHPGMLVFGMKDRMAKVVFNPKLESRIPPAILERAR